MATVPSIKGIVRVLKNLKPEETQWFLRKPPEVNPAELKFVKHAPLERDAFQAQYIYEETIPLHQSRSIHPNNPYIRKLYEKGLDKFLEENTKKVASETIDIDNEIIRQFRNLKPTEKSVTTFRGIVEFDRPHYLDTLYNTNVGDTIVLDYGYSHSALSKAVAEDFASQVCRNRKAIIETTYQPGSLLSISSEYGGEALAPRGMKYIVKEKRINNDGSLYLKLENVLPYEFPAPIQKTEELLAYEQRLLERENLPPKRGRTIYDSM